MTRRVLDMEARRARPLLVRLAKDLGLVAREVTDDAAMACLRELLDACDGTTPPLTTYVGRMTEGRP